MLLEEAEEFRPDMSNKLIDLEMKEKMALSIV